MGTSSNDENTLLFPESTEWSKSFPESNGTKQSPINLVSKSAVYDPKLKEKLLTISYLASRETDFLNTGQTVVIYLHSTRMCFFKFLAKPFCNKGGFRIFETVSDGVLIHI